MSDALFDLEPAALVYPWPCEVPLHKQRCRECHKRGQINGGGTAGGYCYAICQECFHDHGELGDRARRAGIKGRELLVIGAES